MAVPRHPEEDDETSAETAPSRATLVIIAVVVLVLLAHRQGDAVGAALEHRPQTSDPWRPGVSAP
jgi:hypothetical protein